MKSKIILALLILSFSYVFAQDNPYEVFGHTSKVVYETKVLEYLTVKNSDTTSLTKSIAFNIEEGLVLFLGDKDTILKTAKMQPEQLLRWFSVDLLAKKYPQYSPYNFVDGNPIRSIDPDGKDIVVLNNPNGASGFGHMAALIGNDETGWTFVSKEGRDKTPWYSNEVTGGPALEPKIKVFTTLDAFKKAQESDASLGAYTQNVRLAATEIQDKKALNATTNAAKSWYNVTNNNCADAVSKGLVAAGFDPGYESMGISIDDNPWSMGKPVKSLSPVPKLRFKEIEINNKAQIAPNSQSVSPPATNNFIPNPVTPLKTATKDES